MDSTWVFYNQKGEIIEKIDYKYGKKNGYSLIFSYEKYPEGKVISKELYLNDKKEGKALYYFANGNIKEEINYVNGKRQGIAKEFDESGKVTVISEYQNNYLINRERINRIDLNGMKQGTWKIFQDNGNLYKEMFYVNNILEGIYREYDNNGKLYLTLRYEDGKIKEDEKKDNNEIDINFKYDIIITSN